MVQRGATPHDKQKLATISKRVASSVTEIVHAAEAIKGMGLPRNKTMQIDSSVFCVVSIKFMLNSKTTVCTTGRC